ncbi:methyl-accepting chemotaxis protein [Methylobacterium planeticum]|uniref:HAMP domain-containing protein n=1 Tax=Methylobacterium planeticum TaxID=2615211 RepID=A0A6N6MTT0_9HYPH|nr:methyl-accepting chemotaxis protein [Methylobacterium planeticum]KAB1073915.1 HAMP domain-containing protein [Methylobacterium planeticum]
MALLARISITKKIVSVIALVGVVIAGCVFYAQARMTAIDDAYSVFLERDAKAAADTRRMNRYIFEMNYAIFRAIAETEPTQMQAAERRFEAAVPKLRALLADVRQLVPAFVPQIDAVSAKIEVFIRDASAVRALALENRNDQAVELVHRAIDPAFDALTNSSITLSEAISDAIKRGSDDLTVQTNQARLNLILLSAFGVAAGFLGAILIAAFGITRPIGSLVTALERMARGDATAEIREVSRGDEIGAVGRAVEGIKSMVAQKAAEQAEIARISDAAAADERRRTMIELADRFETAVGGIVGSVSASATELQATAQTLTATATETAAQSTTVAAAAEQAAANVAAVAAAAEELGGSVDEIGRRAGGSADLAQVAVGEADESALLVNALSDSASKVGAVVAMIANIAGQTNLLALNATIEAARAGEAGRGFAVVATEVKELASQTDRATREISDQISEIQAVTGRAVSAIESISGRIREINGVATSIAAAVEEQGAATQEIVRNVAQAAAGTTEVTSNVSGVARAAEETGAAASQVLTSASELSRQSEHLGDEVGRFLATVRAA